MCFVEPVASKNLDPRFFDYIGNKFYYDADRSWWKSQELAGNQDEWRWVSSPKETVWYTLCLDFHSTCLTPVWFMVHILSSLSALLFSFLTFSAQSDWIFWKRWTGRRCHFVIYTLFFLKIFFVFRCVFAFSPSSIFFGTVYLFACRSNSQTNILNEFVIFLRGMVTSKIRIVYHK